MKKNKFQKLLDTLQGNDPNMIGGFKAFDEGVQKLKSNLEETIKVSTVDDVNSKLASFQKRLDFAPLLEAFDELKNELVTRDLEREDEVKSELENRLAEINKQLADRDIKAENQYQDILKEGIDLENQITEIANRKLPEQIDYSPQIKDVESRLFALIQSAKQESLEADKTDELRILITALEETVKKLRSDLISVGSRGGGNQNRNISIGGNSSVLSRYADINLKAGSNVTLTYSNNDTTKNVDITIAATGGGGGTTRTIKTITVSSTIGTLSGTDQVILANGGVQVTLPTAVSDTNLYTIKNVGTSSVLIATTSAQTIDDQANIIMPIQYTSVDLISNNSNWEIT